MSKLAILGGKPVSPRWISPDPAGRLRFRPDLERKYLLEAYDTGHWDDWPEAPQSQACKFAREWAAFSGARHAVLATNGTHTLQLILEALGVGPGDEVIVPGLTWQATAAVVCDVNAVPILVDVDPLTLCIDPRKAASAITRRTKAIIPVHLYHRMADMDALLRLARKHKLHVIEDCAHTHGSRWSNRGAGTLGAAGSFSFQRSKLMNSGEGGAVVTNSDELFWRLRSLRSCGREEKKGVRLQSGNYRLTSLQAGILRGQLAAFKLNAPVIDRVGKLLDRAVDAAPGVRALARHPRITRQCSYSFVFLYDKRKYDGLPGAVFRKALSAELGKEFATTYGPLNDSWFYDPTNKRRHHLGREYLKAIDPKRWTLPVCDDLYRDSAIVTSWKAFGCRPDKVGHLTDAIAKIYEHRKALLAAHAPR